MSPWYEWESAGPIAVEGGIKARSKRGAIGEQWWSRRFIAVLDSYGMSSRLQRGRSYARRGQVLEFTLAAGKVAARVQGSRPSPYQVSITVRPLTAAQWRDVESRLSSQALFRARLLAGEMPAEIEEVFASCGTPLFPESSSDLTMSCNCPDWGVPCKHLAAVCYVLAEAFDADPFAMLAWRGKGRGWPADKGKRRQRPLVRFTHAATVQRGERIPTFGETKPDLPGSFLTKARYISSAAPDIPAAGAARPERACARVPQGR